MKKYIQYLLGLNAASILRGVRLGFPEFLRACFAGLAAVHPLQSRENYRLQKTLKAIPEMALDDVLGERKVAIKLRVQKYEDGMMPVHEAMVLLSILVKENPKEVLEIGTFMGHTTKAMAENVPEAIIHTSDLPPDFSADEESQGGPPKDDFHLIRRRIPGREFLGLPVAERIKQHFGDTAVMDFQQFGRPAFFFIDGSHTYEYCRQDSEKCLALCSGGAVFLWHDCDLGHPGVIKFISEWRAAGRNIVRIAGTSMAYWKTE